MARCRYFATPGGCSRGRSCTFEHSAAAQPASAASSSRGHSNAPATRGGRGGGRGGRGGFINQPRDSRYTPNGICRSFYHDGSCERGSDCKFQHRSKDAASASREPLFDDSALAAGRLDSSALHSIDPNDKFGDFERVFTKMEESSYNCLTPTGVYIFVKGLLATTQETTSWSFQDTQSPLAKLAKVPSNLNSRLRDILAWPDVKTSLGGGSKSLLFQSSFVPLFLYLSSPTVLNSTSAHHVNALYTLLDANVESWAPKTTVCLEEMMDRGFVHAEGGSLLGKHFKPEGFLEFLLPLAKVLCAYLARFDKALIAHGSSLTDLVSGVRTAFATYSKDVRSTSPTFTDQVSAMSPQNRNYVISEAAREFQRLAEIIDRVQGRRAQAHPQRSVGDQLSRENAMAIVKLRQLYEEPGHFRRLGPRHDNDHASISDIALLPTHAELVSEIPPYLPGNVASAPHHLGVGTMERQLDVVFRLLRENSVGPIRSAVQSLLLDLRGQRQRQLAAFLQGGGGRWRASDSSNAVDLNVYGDVAFKSIAVLRNDLVVELSLKAPKGAGTSREINKKLNRGGLVGLLLRQVTAEGTEELKVFLGEISEDVVWGSASQENRRGSVKVAFHDSAVFANAVRHLDRRARQSSTSPMTFFEVPGMILSTLIPFLKRLQTVEPSSIPFGRWIASTTDASTPLPAMEPPRFARSPSFSYDLTCFLRPGEVEGGLKMIATEAASVERACDVLKTHSSFDESQAEAFTSTLTREVAMIQGPPGTGKSWIGVKLVQMLRANDIGPIFVIAYTNHALDQFLHDIYLNVTEDIIRCGSRSKNETIQGLNLYDASKEAGGVTRSTLKQQLFDEYSAREAIEEDLNRLCTIASLASDSNVKYDNIAPYLKSEQPVHAALLASPPSELTATWEADVAGGWQQTGKHAQARRSPAEMPFVWWKEGWDIELFKRAKAEQDGQQGRSQPLEPALFAPDPSLGGAQGAEALDDSLPAWVRVSLEADSVAQEDAPTTRPGRATLPFLSNWTEPRGTRHLRRLVDADDIWGMSKAERRTLVAYWVQDTLAREIPKFAALREAHRAATDRINALHDQRRLEVLRKAKVIGSTTNGAANLLSLLTAVAPRVLIVEEAGECLESHILANLVPSIEQIILIGDPLQLRPHVENYQLSVDSSSGKLYRLDESLFERLVNAQLPYSVLQTQRRMRPEISALIRNHLYPELVDHSVVLSYPPLKGLARSVFFFDHQHAEDKQQRESSSKTNTFEARVVVDLVVHFIKQGYQPGDIAVLSPYLGQVKLLKQLLSASKLEVELDERDAAELNRMADDSGEEEPVENLSPKTFEQRTADSLVTLRSVDNFQGEEAKIILLSLTRNVGHSVDDEGVVVLNQAARASIGFLKSPNRTNVALSRAKHGMILLGNASLFRGQASMWESVITTLEEQDAVGDALPIRCEQHPEELSFVKEPGVVSQISPQGGCLKRCDAEMPCHHKCPRLCHPTDKKHVHTRCIEPCSILLDCKHACKALCGDKHVCDWIEPAVTLPCGHDRLNVPCAEAQDPETLVCRTNVTVTLPCKHTVAVRCGTDTTQMVCKQVCGMALNCRHESCKSTCGVCRPPSFFATLPTPTLKHASHRCSKVLNCNHECLGDCVKHSQNGCGMCEAPCERRCEHGACSHKCGREACRSCLDPCAWGCRHQGACGNTCSMPCARLPCDLPCPRKLKCGHPCPSICAEDCSKQICVSCATEDQKSMVVDFIMMSTLGEIDLKETGLDNRIITLHCGHAFTVETLDGIFELEKYYIRDAEGNWTGLLDFNPRELHPFECSQCRQPISIRWAKRYGRPLKQVDLGLQEDSALIRGNRQLQSVSSSLERFDISAIELDPIDRLQALSHPTSNNKQLHDYQRQYLVANQSIITPSSAYQQLHLHGVSSTLETLWKKMVGPLLNLYESLVKLATLRAPLTQAYESAFTKLLREVKQQLNIVDGTSAEADLLFTADALREAYSRTRLLIGAPTPRAGAKNTVEAVWLSLALRDTLFSVGEKIAERLRQLAHSSSAPKHVDLSVRRLNLFLRFVLQTSIRDVKMTIELTQASAATRQELTSLLRLAHLTLALSRYDTQRHVETTKRGEGYKLSSVVSGIRRERESASRLLEGAVDRARNGLRGNVEAIKTLDQWLEVNIWTSLQLIDSGWEKLLRYAEAKDFYEAMDPAELQAIVAAMSSSVSSSTYPTGHWYRCPNGHPFVIADCGMANQAGVCNECGANLGGQGHHNSALAAGNVRDEELEALHRQTIPARR